MSKDAMTMTPEEWATAREAAIRQRPQAKSAPPADKRPASETSAAEWAAAHPPKPKLATEMTAEEYAAAKAELFRRR